MRLRLGAVFIFVGLLVACAVSPMATEEVPGNADDAGVAFGEGGVRCGEVETTVSGVVRTAAKVDADPVYNAVVYSPKGPPPAFPTGVACERCASMPSSAPWASTSTTADGRFTLKGVPPGRDVPLVVQVGRWRREIVIPEVKACADNVLAAELTRLPRNHVEGNIPRIATPARSPRKRECSSSCCSTSPRAFRTIARLPRDRWPRRAGDGIVHWDGATPRRGALMRRSLAAARLSAAHRAC